MPRPPSSQRTMVEAVQEADVPIYCVDANRVVRYCNPACLAWLDVEQNQVVGKTCRYHSDPTALDAVTAGLCPPPEAFEQPNVESVVWKIGKDGVITRRSARFVMLPRAKGLDILLSVVGDFDLVDTGTRQESDRSTNVTLHHQLVWLRAQLPAPPTDFVMLGPSSTAHRIRTQTRVAAEADVNVLLYGASGGQREILARQIHRMRVQGRSGIILPIDCPMMDADLLETTFDAFVERFDAADNESKLSLLLLDVDHLNADCQRPLLQRLEDVSTPRTVFATSSQLLAHVDGFYPPLADRLATLVIAVPALRERIDDLPLLIQALIEQENQHVAGDRQVGRIDDAALRMLMNHHWQDDIDELEAIVSAAHRASGGGTIFEHHLPAEVSLSADAERLPPVAEQEVRLDEYLAEIEQELIQRALALENGNRAAAARRLGITRARLLRRLESSVTDDQP